MRVGFKDASVEKKVYWPTFLATLVTINFTPVSGSVGVWVGGWAEFQASVALRLASLLGISLVIERQLGKPDVRLFVFPHRATHQHYNVPKIFPLMIISLFSPLTNQCLELTG